MPPTLYHVPRTISSPLVQLLLELGLVNTPVVVKELTFPDLKTPDYLSNINPMGTSPAFHDEGIVLWESGAILDYLLERYDTQKQYYPPPITNDSTEEEVRRRSKYLQLKQFILATVYPFIASMYIHSLKPVAEQDVKYMEEAKKKCHTVLGPVMTKWLGDGPFLLGKQFSALDLLVAKPLGNVDSLGLLSEFPALQGLLQRVASRPTYTKAYTAIEKGRPEDQQTIVLVPKSAVEKKDRLLC